MLGAGVGAPLLRLWAFAALDPAASGGRSDKTGAGGDGGDGGGSGTAGIGRARARLGRLLLNSRIFISRASRLQSQLLLHLR